MAHPARAPQRCVDQRPPLQARQPGVDLQQLRLADGASPHGQLLQAAQNGKHSVRRQHPVWQHTAFSEDAK